MKLAQTYTAKDIIERFKRRAYIDDMVVAHECDWLFKPDIVTITRDHKVNEYEIKVSLSDLRRELDYIDFAIQDHNQQMPIDFEMHIDGESVEDRQKRRDFFYGSQLKNMRHDSNKYTKHRLYLFAERGRYNRGQPPNRFYFILPPELYQAEKVRLDRLPYGVLRADYFYSLKRCKPLHQREIELHAMWQVALNLTARVKAHDYSSQAPNPGKSA